MSAQQPSIGIILMSDELEKLHAGALVGSVASMSGMKVNVFVTMNALTSFHIDHFKKQEFKTGVVGKELLLKDIPLFDHLLKEGKDVGDLHIYGCALAMDIMGWQQDDMINVFDDIIGVTKFLTMTQGSQVITM
ncbi:DsrE/DsrF/DrsH-like family protein [Cytobacillus sp. Hm23]